jgi:phosphatidylglycerophosphate synthase/putative flippase GtrA
MRSWVSAWLAGRLSGAERVVSALAPLVVLVLFVLGGALLYAWQNRRHGHFHDEEMDERGLGGLTTPGLRHFFAWLVRPLWQPLARSHFPPDLITTLSTALALGAGLGVAGGRFALGGWLYLAAGLLDFLDGRVARATGRSSNAGAALDSVLDRYVESAFLMGLCWYYRDGWVLGAGLVALVGSLLVPYVRARGEALAVVLKDTGFMQRAERVVSLGAGVALSPVLEVFLSPGDPHPPHRLAIGALLVVAVTSQVTALQRLVALRAALRGERRPRPSLGRPLKSALSNGLATAVDGAVASALYYWSSKHPGVATALGCAAGALVSFTLSRVWAFEVKGGPVLAQIARYAFGSVSTLALNAGGVVLMTELGVPFLPAWAITRVVVFATWSYPVQRDFVFAEAWLATPGGPRGR